MTDISHQVVRSFDNVRPETIYFYTPLTLIVGYNGSGKTTIIECLKYATTGELPPNSKGGAFIHDPKLCNEKEVLAQVKLAFKSTSGNQIVITRNIQLTVKKPNPQQKTLEATILTKTRDGERTSISSRVAELDQLMPQYLGVSKAVLDFVIFCHQDESLWPMSEPASLKKKFDEIFEALKYTKAIDNIKSLRKTKNEDLKRLKEREQDSKNTKARADRAEKQSKDLDAALREMRREIDDLEAKTNDAAVKFRDASDRAAKYKTLAGSLDNHRKEQAWLQARADKLSMNLKERSESDQWLQSEIDQYEERMVEHKKHEERQTGKYQEFEHTVKNGEARLSRKHVEAGKLEEQKINHEQQIERRKALIRETSHVHQIRGYDTDLDDMQINEYMDKISRLSKDQSAAVEKARRETEHEMEKAQDILNKLGEEKSVLKETRKSAKEQSATNDNLLRAKYSQLNSIEIDEGGKAILEANIEDLEARLKKAADDSNKAAWDSKIKEIDIQSRELREEEESLDGEMYQGTKQAGELARLDGLQNEAAEYKRNLEQMKGAHGGRLHKILGHDWQPSDLESSFQKVIDEKSRIVKEAERERELVSRRLEQVEYKLANAKIETKKAEKELAACVKYLNDNVEGEPEDYSETLAEIQEARDLYKADFDNFQNLRNHFAKALKAAQGKNQCNLCHRPFHGKELTDFIKKMEANMTQKTAEKVAQDLKEAEEDLRKAKEAGSSHDTWVRLSRTVLPGLREDLNRLGADREKVLREMEDHDKTVKDREDAKMDVESLMKPVANITKYYHGQADRARQIKEIAETQKDSGNSRSLQDVRDQLHVVKRKSQDLRSNVDKLRTDKERARSLISKLQLDLSNAKNSYSTATYQLEKKQGISKQIEELKGANRGHQKRIHELEISLQDLTPRIGEQENKIQEIRERGLGKEHGLQQEASRLKENVHKLELAAQIILAYAEDGGSAKLDKCRREIDSVEQEISDVKHQQRQVTVSINKVRQELSNQDATKRNIADNIEHRQTLREIEDEKAEIAKLSAEYAEADREHWIDQEKHWQRMYNKHKTENTSKIGTAKAKDDELVRLINDWTTDYKHAARDFKKAHIEVETTKAAIEDLGRYASALDKAIMQYHSIKMREINRIAEELWKKTYQGTDVDTILIRSDNESAKGNRSYNYRVCMVKQDAEMDMRGRCSAGQKVLASIIIRLALAECFGVNCGLIALDEPTTNLDRDNIRSLATSLHDIIETRRHQSNFQLIVITHDEEFLKFMKCPDFCDNYWRVSRSDRQKSIIEKQSIAEVM